MKNIFSFARTHKKISAVVAIVILVVGYWAYGVMFPAATTTRYVVGTVTRGTIVASVSGSGQVLASNQLDIKPNVSGQIIAVDASSGEHVSAGQLIAVIDPSDAQKAVRDAQVSLQSAQLALQKLQEPADALSLTQAQNNAQNATDDLTRAYTSSYTDVTSFYLDLPDLMTNLQDIVTGTEAARGSQWNIDYYKNAIEGYDGTNGVSSSESLSYRDTAYNAYLNAQKSYAAALADYQLTSQSSDTATIEKITNETYASAQAIADALGSVNSFLRFYEDQVKAHNQNPSATADTALTNLTAYIGKMNTHLSALLADINTFKTDKQNVTETTQSLQKLQTGTDPLDVQSSQLSLTQRQNALTDAQNALADYYIRAPFAGTLAVVNAKKFDTAGSGTALATLITTQQMAQLSLNEVDAAKVKVGDKATLTFDAIDGLTLTGRVAEINSIGTVSQGVVSYTVQIGLDTQDDRIKPGMTVNAAIQTDVHQDVLTLPSSAVKTKNNASYVEVFDPALPAGSGTTSSQGVVSSLAPKQIPVTTGIADDVNVEVLSGVTEGQQIVVRTVSNTAQTTTTGTSAAAGAARGGGFGGGGAGIRIP